MRAELFRICLCACACAGPGPSGGATATEGSTTAATATPAPTTTTTGASMCAELAFDDGVPLAWSFCGCSEESPWYARCDEGFFCEQAFKSEQVLGGTCSPLCSSDRECAAYPFEGYEVECGGHHCEIRCNAAVPCPADMVCQGDNCIHAPSGG